MLQWEGENQLSLSVFAELLQKNSVMTYSTPVQELKLHSLSEALHFNTLHYTIKIVSTNTMYIKKCSCIANISRTWSSYTLHLHRISYLKT